MALLPFAGPPGKSPITNTKALILAGTATLGQFAYATDTKQLFVGDGTNWQELPVNFITEGGNPDTGLYEENNKFGLTLSYITDRLIANCAIGSNATTTNGAIRTINGKLQIYLNSVWNDVVINFRLREDANDSYVFEHQPTSFSSWIEIYTGNSTDVGLNGKPIVQGYKVSTGAYPVDQIINCGTF